MIVGIFLLLLFHIIYLIFFLHLNFHLDEKKNIINSTFYLLFVYLTLYFFIIIPLFFFFLRSYVPFSL